MEFDKTSTRLDQSEDFSFTWIDIMCNCLRRPLTSIFKHNLIYGDFSAREEATQGNYFEKGNKIL